LLAAASKSDLQATGIVSMRADIRGTVKQPAGTATVALRDLKVGADEYGNVNVDATLAEGRARVKAAADKFKLTANVDLATAAPYPGNVEVAINPLDLKSLPMPQQTPITGSVSAHLTASGDLSSPLDAIASVTLDPLALTYNNQPIATEGVSTVRYA